MPKQPAKPEIRPLASVLLAGVVGCGGPRPAAVHEVAGTLTVDGRPAANAMVAFHPLDRSGPPSALPVARTSPDGSFRLTTRASGDGAPAGRYAVTVVWPDQSVPHDECEEAVTHDRFAGRYADPAASPLRVTVGPGPNEVPLRVALAGGPQTRHGPTHPTRPHPTDRPSISHLPAER